MDWQNSSSWWPLASHSRSSLLRACGGCSAHGCQSGLVAVRALKSPATTGVQPASDAAAQSPASRVSQAAESSAAWVGDGGLLGPPGVAWAVGDWVEDGGGR